MARVLAIHPARVDVEACSAGRCAQCPGSCNWGGFRGPRRLSLNLPGHLALQPGDQVWIGLSPQAMLRGAWWAYGFPLAGLLVGAGLGNFLAGDKLALGFGALGVGLGWWLARQLSHRFWPIPSIEAMAGMASP
jgi:positive regulator of sigma E activity